MSSSDSDVDVERLVVDEHGSCSDSNGGEYCLHRDWTIFVMRDILLLEEQINLDINVS